jgi:PAS domain S-box-containing protein
MERNDELSSAEAGWKQCLTVFETLPDLYLVFSADLLVLTVSNAYLNFFGLSRARIQGKHLADLIPQFPGAPERAFEKLISSARRVVASKKPEDMPVRPHDVGKTAAGVPKVGYFQGSNTPVLNADGEILYIVHKVMDVTTLVDYSKRLKQSQVDLKNETRRLKQAQSTAHIGSYEWNSSTGSLYWSDEMFRIYGLTPQAEGIQFDEALSYLHPEDVEKANQAIKDLMENRKQVDIVHRIILKNGEVRYIRSIGQIAEGKTSEIIRLYGTVQDITESVRSTEKILASEELLRRAEEAGNTGSYEATLGNSVFRFSDGMFRILGYEPNAFTPTIDMLESILEKNNEKRLVDMISEIIENKQQYEDFRSFHTPSGELRHILSRGKVICNEKGEPVKVFGVVHDITARKQAEEQLSRAHEELQRNKDLLQSVFDYSKIGISVLKAVFNAEGLIEDFEIKLVSKELERQTGRQDLVGKLYAKEYPGVKKNGLFDVMLRVMRTGKAEQLEYYYEHDGFHNWYASTFAKMDNGLVASNLDITSARAAAEQIRKIEERQKVEIFKTAISIQEEERKQFSENLRNGIGQLLYAVKVNLTHVVASKNDTDLTAFKQAKEHTDAILREAIQETRRIAHQMTPAILEDFGLQESIKDLCKQFRASLPIATTFKGLNRRFDKYLEVSVYRMVQELVTNIVKHAKASAASVSLQLNSRQISLSVEDDGIGFDPVGVKTGGLGLLTLSNKVKLLNGTVDIRAGRGTRVHIVIPLKTL